MSIIFENDGIYICQYNASYVWTELEELKHYLDDKSVTYTIIDYQD
ncbi:hypothetical protein [Aquimarina rubra]|uniref:Uncharacterized protein n=1 Tax=Aquimarina rubra TaxID=1920033 RepID=A0ABW5LDE5_9FLAO